MTSKMSGKCVAPVGQDTDPNRKCSSGTILGFLKAARACFHAGRLEKDSRGKVCESLRVLSDTAVLPAAAPQVLGCRSMQGCEQ